MPILDEVMAWSRIKPFVYANNAKDELFPDNKIPRIDID